MVLESQIDFVKLDLLQEIKEEYGGGEDSSSGESDAEQQEKQKLLNEDLRAKLLQEPKSEIQKCQESLPMFQSKSGLLKAIRDNQV